MAIVTNITKGAEQVLQQHGIRYEYGYGDAYHFSSQIPQKTSVDIAERFALADTKFVVVGTTLQLEDEVEQQK
jgi:hypothetical protein